MKTKTKRDLEAGMSMGEDKTFTTLPWSYGGWSQHYGIVRSRVFDLLTDADGNDEHGHFPDP